MQQDTQRIGDSHLCTSDPEIVNWKAVELPDAWPDQIDLSKMSDLWKIIKHAVSKQRSQVQLPDNMPGAECIPKYILQEFHNMPNGNYSKKLTRGYINSLDKMMLGSLQQARLEIARTLTNLDRVLDVGCSSGRLAAEIQRGGAKDVWGLDPSPYFLQHAATDYPSIKLVQGLAEDTNFIDNRFQAVSCCFLLHELPPKYTHEAIAEFSRICEPGGLLCIAEPSPQQMQNTAWELFKLYGFKGFYFYILAAKVHEPFAAAWHKLNIAALLSDCEFDLISDKDKFPVRIITARRR